MCAKSAKFLTDNILASKFGFPDPKTIRNDVLQMFFIIFMIAYSRISLFSVKFFKLDPRNTLILAGKNGTQFFSIN